MDVAHAGLDGVLVFTPTAHRDERGMFTRTFDVDLARAAGIDPHAFTQDSLSRSGRGVLRGLHLRSGAGEAKLVRCSSGRVFDVVVDLRPSSPTYGWWESFDLDGATQTSIYLQPAAPTASRRSRNRPTRATASTGHTTRPRT